MAKGLSWGAANTTSFSMYYYRVDHKKSDLVLRLGFKVDWIRDMRNMCYKILNTND